VKGRFARPISTGRQRGFVTSLATAATFLSMLVVGAVPGLASTGIASGTAATPTSLTIGVSIEPGNLDVQLTSTAVVNEAMYNIYEALTQFDRKANTVPQLAVSWKNVSPTRWRFNLRKGVKFTNGEAFTPAAAVFSIQRALTPSSTNLGYYSLLQGASVVSGANAIYVDTKSPDPSLPTELSFLPMVPPKYVQNDLTDYLQKAVGTGPYVFHHWTRGQEIVVTANPKWWGGKPRYKKVTFKLIPDANVRLQALKAGELNFATALDPSSISQIPQPFLPPSNTVCVFRLNNQSAPFSDVRVRRAANYAIDRKSIVSALFPPKLASVANGQVVAAASFGFSPKLRDYPYDVSQAKSLLSSSGYNGQAGTVMSPSGHWTGDRDIFLAATNYLTKAGFNIQPKIVDFSVWRTGYFAAPKPDIAFVCTGDDGLTGFRPLVNLATPNGPQSSYVNQTIGAEITKAQSEFNVNKRRADMQQIWSDLKDDAFTVPIASVSQVDGGQRNIYWRTPRHGRVYANDIIILKKSR